MDCFFNFSHISQNPTVSLFAKRKPQLKDYEFIQQNGCVWASLTHSSSIPIKGKKIKGNNIDYWWLLKISLYDTPLGTLPRSSISVNIPAIVGVKKTGYSATQIIKGVFQSQWPSVLEAGKPRNTDRWLLEYSSFRTLGSALHNLAKEGASIGFWGARDKYPSLITKT